MNDKISIIICCYNQGRFLQDTLNSAFSQTYKNLEIVLVNDGSTDETHEIALKNKKEDNFIYINQENLGLGLARNNGIMAASGKWIFILDSDDIIAPNYLNEASKLIKNDNSVIYPLNSFFYGNIENSELNPYTPINSTLEQELSEFASFVSLLVKKENLIKCGMYLIEREFMQITDYDISLKLRGLGCEFITLLNHKLFFYRRHDSNMTYQNWFRNVSYYYNLLKYRLHFDKYKKQIEINFQKILDRNPTHIEHMHYIEKIKIYEYSFFDLKLELINFPDSKFNSINK